MSGVKPIVSKQSFVNELARILHQYSPLPDTRLSPTHQPRLRARVETDEGATTAFIHFPDEVKDGDVSQSEQVRFLKACHQHAPFVSPTAALPKRSWFPH